MLTYRNWTAEHGTACLLRFYLSGRHRFLSRNRRTLLKFDHIVEKHNELFGIFFLSSPYLAKFVANKLRFHMMTGDRLFHLDSQGTGGFLRRRSIACDLQYRLSWPRTSAVSQTQIYVGRLFRQPFRGRRNKWS